MSKKCLGIIINIEKLRIIWISTMDKNIKQKQNYNGSAEKNRKDEEYKTDNQIQKIKESESNYRLKSNK